MVISNSKISDVKHSDGDVNALYHGNKLIWRRQSNNILNVTSFDPTYQANLTSGVNFPTYETFNSDQDYFVDLTKFSGRQLFGSAFGSGSGDRTKNIKRVNSMPSVRYVKDASGMFNGCSNCEYIPTLDFSSNLQNMSYLFCSLPLEQIDVSGYDTSNVTNMRAVFFNMTQLQSLDISNWDTGSVINMEGMLGGLMNCTSITLGENFNTGKVSNMSSMFEGDKLLKNIDLGKNFFTNNVEDMSNMFECLESIEELDLGNNFDTSEVKNMYNMFRDCFSLQRLNVGYKFSMELIEKSGGNLGSNSGMFLRCYLLSEIKGKITHITKSISFEHCPLTNETAQMIIDGLENVNKETITFSTTTYPQLTSEQIALATSKGWTVAMG